MKNLPSYLVIEQALRQGMEHGEWKPGDRIPEEHALARKFRTSRPTLRKALAMLAAEGRLHRIPGRGTFVVSPEHQSHDVLRRRQQYLKKVNKSVAVLVPSVRMALGAGIVCGVEEACRQRGYHIVLGNYEADPRKEQECVDLFLERGVSGFVVFAGWTSAPDVYRSLARRCIPLVFAGSGIEGMEADMVKTDNIAAATDGTRELLRNGGRTVAFFCLTLKSVTARERFIGYKEALSEAGLPFRPELVFEERVGENERDEIRRSTELLTRYGVDAILSANETNTVLLAKIFRNGSSGAPKMAAIDQPPFFDFSGCDVVFYRQPAHNIGSVAAQLLMEKVEKRNDPDVPCRRILLPANRATVETSLAKQEQYACP